jgi:dihydrofolate reductase
MEDDAMGDVFGYLALSLDGYIAGPGDDLSFLPAPEVEGEDHGFAALLATVGCLLMGRRTFDVVMGFDGPWPYGDLPILVATRRPLPALAPATVRAAEGEIGALVRLAKEIAGEGRVYVDGGQVLGAALGAGLVDELTLTSVPVLLGGGAPLCPGLPAPVCLRLLAEDALHGGMIRRRYAVLRPEPA